MRIECWGHVLGGSRPSFAFAFAFAGIDWKKKKKLATRIAPLCSENSRELLSFLWGLLSCIGNLGLLHEGRSTVYGTWHLAISPFSCFTVKDLRLHTLLHRYWRQIGKIVPIPFWSKRHLWGFEWVDSTQSRRTVLAAVFRWVTWVPFDSKPETKNKY